MTNGPIGARSWPVPRPLCSPEQSVSGMKPTFTSFFSGASEPCAHAPVRTTLISPVAPAAFRNSRFFIASPLVEKKGVGQISLPNAFVRDGRTVAPATCFANPVPACSR